MDMHVEHGLLRKRCPGNKEEQDTGRASMSMFDDHQILMARAGSTSAARRAGNQLAAMTTTRRTATAATRVTGSCGATPKSSVRAKRLLTTAPTIPTVPPAAARTSDSI